MEYVLTHELIHPYISNEMRTIITKFAEGKNKSEYKKAIEDLKALYGTSEITDEIVADAGAQLFGTQEFLNTVATENPTMLKKIYNKVVSMLNRITRYTNEKLVLQDFKNKIESAIRNNDITMENKTESYLIAGKQGMNNAIKQNPSKYIMLEQKYNQAQKLRTNGLSNEEILKTTGWFQDKNGDWKYEFLDKDLKIKKNLKNGEIDKLGNVIEHKILFDFYPDFKNIDIMLDNTLKKRNKSII